MKIIALKIICLSSITFTTNKSQNYCIRKDYTSRMENIQQDTRNRVTHFQEEVYALAHKLAQKKSYKKIGDIGCGSADKLLKYFSAFDTVGYELEPMISWLKSTHPTRSWIYSNFQNPLGNHDLIITADVIEHLQNPDQLLQWINLSNPKLIVISTPDRSVLVKKYNGNEFGPPTNPYHIREWNFQEFEQYISQWFQIIKHVHAKKQTECQIIVCKKI